MYLLTTWILLTSMATLTASQSCPDGFIKHRDSCYVIIHIPADWIEASDFCGKLHGKLLEIDSSIEDNFIKEYLKSSVHPSTVVYWTGGTDAVIEGEWRWISDLRLFDYTNWAKGEPNDLGSKEDCAEVVLTNSSYYWNDAPCEYKYSFICEKE